MRPREVYIHVERYENSPFLSQDVVIVEFPGLRFN